MKTTQMSEIERALHAIRLILADRNVDGESTPSIALTDLGELPPPRKQVPARSLEEDKFASQEREAVRLCLTSAAALLAVVQRLVIESAVRSPGDRAQHVPRLVADIRTGGRTAYHAALVLLGQDTRLAPPIDTSKVAE